MTYPNHEVVLLFYKDNYCQNELINSGYYFTNDKDVEVKEISQKEAEEDDE